MDNVKRVLEVFVVVTFILFACSIESIANMIL